MTAVERPSNRSRIVVVTTALVEYGKRVLVDSDGRLSGTEHRLHVRGVRRGDRSTPGHGLVMHEPLVWHRHSLQPRLLRFSSSLSTLEFLEIFLRCVKYLGQCLLAYFDRLIACICFTFSVKKRVRYAIVRDRNSGNSGF